MTPGKVPTRSAGGTLTFEGVSKRFPGPPGSHRAIHALDDASFSIRQNEAVGLIGPNGAGKSTALKLAAGVSGPTAGRITRTGRTSTVIELGAGMHPDLSGRENIDLLTTLAAGRRPRSNAHFDQIVDFSELGEVLDRPTRHYSTGMLARLAFSVAVHSDPDLLLIDEVLSVGDLSFQRRCAERLFELRSGGTTLVVVSHDLGLITETCDRALLLSAGRVELDGEAHAVVRQYVGQPTGHVGTGDLNVRLAAGKLELGRPVELEFDVPGGADPNVVRIEYVVPTHPLIQESGHGTSMVCGSTRLTGTESGPLSLSLTTAGLPPGRYELHVTVETPQGKVLGSEIAEFILAGRPGPFAIRLQGTTLLDGAPVGA
jgi:ABC-type polysaccharide/polyol phosphate transport system ATPase subunit